MLRVPMLEVVTYSFVAQRLVVVRFVEEAFLTFIESHWRVEEPRRYVWLLKGKSEVWYIPVDGAPKIGSSLLKKLLK